MQKLLGKLTRNGYAFWSVVAHITVLVAFRVFYNSYVSVIAVKLNLGCRSFAPFYKMARQGGLTVFGISLGSLLGLRAASFFIVLGGAINCRLGPSRFVL